jgi:hypothetical protein
VKSLEEDDPQTVFGSDAAGIEAAPLLPEVILEHDAPS